MPRLHIDSFVTRPLVKSRHVSVDLGSLKFMLCERWGRDAVTGVQSHSIDLVLFSDVLVLWSGGHKAGNGKCSKWLKRKGGHPGN